LLPGGDACQLTLRLVQRPDQLVDLGPHPALRLLLPQVEQRLWDGMKSISKCRQCRARAQHAGRPIAEGARMASGSKQRSPAQGSHTPPRPPPPSGEAPWILWLYRRGPGRRATCARHPRTWPPQRWDSPRVAARGLLLLRANNLAYQSVQGPIAGPGPSDDTLRHGWRDRGQASCALARRHHTSI
jgi:hypothetical protein